jgi:NAD(P)-dependent dehydrogenase (short-subunit alcohol dehydrogenase family)
MNQTTSSVSSPSASSPATKVAIITGAGTGIGAAIARQLAALGWRVVLGGRTAASLEAVAQTIRNAGGCADTVVCDVTQAEDVARLIDAAGSSLDALIHSAGIGHCLTIDELDEAEFKRTLDVAVMGAFLTTKSALPKLRAGTNGCGHIMQICSLASGGTWFREIGYGTAKGAQLKFTLHLASQLEEDALAGGREIHAHAICPGTVATPFWDRIPERPISDPSLCLSADEVAWMAVEILKNPVITHTELSSIKPRPEIVIKPHAPFERWQNIIAIAHESHP